MDDKKILIIDDDVLTLQLYEFLFEEMEGVSFQSVSGGTEALALLDYCSMADWPDYIFVDLYMPDMTGFEFVEEFQNRYGQKDASSLIYVLTNSISRSDIEKGEEHPLITGFLSKPLTEDSLNHVLEGATN